MRYKTQLLPVTAVALAWFLPSALLVPTSRSFSADFFVSSEGNDQWSGRKFEAADGDGPFATLARARDAVRDLKRHEPITVVIRGGRYELTEPLVFTSQDSGSEAAPIAYRAAAGETPVISGGRRITGWDVGADGRWTATAPLDVREAYPLQMTVNGERRYRSRVPKQGFYRVAGLAGKKIVFRQGPPGMPAREQGSGSDRFEYKPGDLDPSWKNPADMVIRMEHFWFDEYLPIKQLDPATHTVTFTRTSQIRFTETHSSTPLASYFVDNVYEALSEPGEWYLDRTTGRLTYLPKPGEAPDHVVAVLPVLEKPVIIRGDQEKGTVVRYLTFEGLSFSDNHWDVPIDTGYRAGRDLLQGDLSQLRPPLWQNAGVKFSSKFQEEYAHLLPLAWPDALPGQSTAAAPGGVSVTRADHITFDACRFLNFETYGLDLGKGVFDCRVTRCEFAHNGAGGVKIGGALIEAPRAEWNGRHVISDNSVHHLGELYPSAAGILSLHSFGNTITHNELHNIKHNGISVGWQWHFIDNVSRDNIVEQNYVHDLCGSLIDDVAGIYLVGIQPGTVVRNNLVRDIAGRPGGWFHGIYLDRGASHILVENNLVWRVQGACFKRNQASNSIVRNNIFASGGPILNLIALFVDDIPTSLFFERNLCVMIKAPSNGGGVFQVTPANAQEVLNGQASMLKFDRNCYWQAGEGTLLIGKPPGLTWSAWQSAGMDVRSIIADPLFTDPENGDFRLKPGSPAVEKLGFKPFDLSNVGPRNRKQGDSRNP